MKFNAQTYHELEQKPVSPARSYFSFREPPFNVASFGLAIAERIFSATFSISFCPQNDRLF
jgi:hypothetical protein